MTETPMKFKIELQLNDRVFKQTFFATNLMDLFNDIAEEYPTAKILSIIGGGT